MADLVKVEVKKPVAVEVKKGWVAKRGQYNKAWQRRWFCLTSEGDLHYFVDEDAEVPRGTIDCGAIADVEAEVEGGEDAKLHFKLVTPKRTWELKAEDEAAQAAWARAIGKARRNELVVKRTSMAIVDGGARPSLERLESSMRDVTVSDEGGASGAGGGAGGGADGGADGGATTGAAAAGAMPAADAAMFGSWASLDLARWQMWSAEEVAAWVASLGLTQYAEAFKAAGVHGSLLASITSHELEGRVGMSSQEHRWRFLGHVQELVVDNLQFGTPMPGAGVLG